MESRLSAELWKLMGQAACVGGKRSRRKHLDKRKKHPKSDKWPYEAREGAEPRQWKENNAGRKIEAHKNIHLCIHVCVKQKARGENRQPRHRGCRSSCGLRQICHKVGLGSSKLAGGKREEEKKKLI